MILFNRDKAIFLVCKMYLRFEGSAVYSCIMTLERCFAAQFVDNFLSLTYFRTTSITHMADEHIC